MAGFETFQGCGTALVTPFSDDESVDEAALAHLVDFQIEEGIDFLVPCGTTGETPTLEAVERIRVVEIVVERARGRVPVLAGAGGNNTRQVVNAAREMAALGVDGLLSVTPYYNKPTQEGLYDHYAAVAHGVELPIVLYNVPGRTGTNLLPETVLRLARIPNIAGIKEASGSITQISEVAMGMPEGFKLLSGDDGIVLPLIALGGHGVISVVSNVVPGAMSELVRLCLAGDLVEARERLPRIDALARACFFETNPIPAKAALAMMGKIRERYRLPMVPMSEANRKRLEEILVEERVLLEAVA